MTINSSVPKSSCEIISERIASSVAIPPAFLITWASPNFNPKISFIDILFHFV
jgi:hypothetical protein